MSEEIIDNAPAPAEQVQPEYICPRCTKELRGHVISPGPVCPRCAGVCKVKVPVGMKRVQTVEKDFERVLGRAMEAGRFSIQRKA